jgi:hypothetical protein
MLHGDCLSSPAFSLSFSVELGAGSSSRFVSFNSARVVFAEDVTRYNEPDCIEPLVANAEQIQACDPLQIRARPNHTPPKPPYSEGQIIGTRLCGEKRCWPLSVSSPSAS